MLTADSFTKINKIPNFKGKVSTVKTELGVDKVFGLDSIAKVLRVFLAYEGFVSRADLIKKTKLSGSPVDSVIRWLISEDIVIKDMDKSRRVFYKLAES